MTVQPESPSLPEVFTQFLDSSSVPLVVADYLSEDCPLIAANEPFCAMSGYTRAEIIGRNCRFLQPQGGAGPVRARMRHFLQDPAIADAKFLIPNVRKNGEPFLNLVYMTKLVRDGQTTMVLGSQFEAGRKGRSAELYDRALAQDLRQLNILMDEHNYNILGSFDALASSHAIIARARMD